MQPGARGPRGRNLPAAVRCRSYMVGGEGLLGKGTASSVLKRGGIWLQRIDG